MVRDHKRKAKFDFEIYHFLHSGVMPLFALAERSFRVIHILWTHGSISYLYS
jgi:hypothetical protein